jgi:hypothetical protein
MARQMLSLITAVLTLWGMWLAGNKRSAGWIVGLVNQVFWLATIIAFGVWGLLPLTVALTVVYSRNLLKPLTPVGIDIPSDPYDLLTPEARAQLFRELAEMARLRRKGEAEARNLWLP